jgi:hypothetical protein
MTALAHSTTSAARSCVDARSIVRLDVTGQADFWLDDYGTVTQAAVTREYWQRSDPRLRVDTRHHALLRKYPSVA